MPDAIIQPKPPEQIQAQIATYATESISNYRDIRYIMDNIAYIATEPLEDVVRFVEADEYHRQDQTADNPTGLTPQGSLKLVGSAKGYVDYLRSQGRNNELIEGRAEFLQAFHPFETQVSELLFQIEDSPEVEKIEGYLTSGASSHIFRIEKDGSAYVVRVPIHSANSRLIDQHVAGGVLSKNLDHTEKLEAASYEYVVTIAHFEEGIELLDISPDEAKAITKEQLDQLVDTALEAHRLGIEVDLNARNILYDRATGFTIIDIHQLNHLYGENQQSPGSIIGDIANSISIMGYTLDEASLTKTEFIQRYESNLSILRALKSSARRRLDNADLPYALAQIDLKIEQVNGKLGDLGGLNFAI